MIAGCDFSSRYVDFVLLEEDTDRAVWHRYELAGADAFDRARSVRLVVPGPAHSLWDDVLAVGIEQPRGKYALVDLARIQGAVLACLPSRMLVQPWNPASWRTAVGLPGNATKEAVFGFAWQTAAHEIARASWPQDACDAYVIAMATRSLLERHAA